MKEEIFIGNNKLCLKCKNNCKQSDLVTVDKCPVFIAVEEKTENDK